MKSTTLTCINSVLFAMYQAGIDVDAVMKEAFNAMLPSTGHARQTGDRSITALAAAAADAFNSFFMQAKRTMANKWLEHFGVAMQNMPVLGASTVCSAINNALKGMFTDLVQGYREYNPAFKSLYNSPEYLSSTFEPVQLNTQLCKNAMTLLGTLDNSPFDWLIKERSQRAGGKARDASVWGAVEVALDALDNGSDFLSSIRQAQWACQLWEVCCTNDSRIEDACEKLARMSAETVQMPLSGGGSIPCDEKRLLACLTQQVKAQPRDAWGEQWFFTRLLNLALSVRRKVKAFARNSKVVKWMKEKLKMDGSDHELPPQLTAKQRVLCVHTLSLLHNLAIAFKYHGLDQSVSAALKDFIGLVLTPLLRWNVPSQALLDYISRDKNWLVEHGMLSAWTQAAHMLEQNPEEAKPLLADIIKRTLTCQTVQAAVISLKLGRMYDDPGRLERGCKDVADALLTINPRVGGFIVDALNTERPVQTRGGGTSEGHNQDQDGADEGDVMQNLADVLLVAAEYAFTANTWEAQLQIFKWVRTSHFVLTTIELIHRTEVLRSRELADFTAAVDAHLEASVEAAVKKPGDRLAHNTHKDVFPMTSHHMAVPITVHGGGQKKSTGKRIKRTRPTALRP
jgi:hypothetical protein